MVQGPPAQPAAALHGLEQVPIRDACGPEPALQAFYRLNPLTLRHRDALAFAGLVRFRFADMHKHLAGIVAIEGGNDLNIIDPQRADFRAA